MQDYKPNSHRFKEEVKSNEERKKVEKVVTGAVKTRKKSKIADAFVSEDASNVKSYVVMDVVVPALKKLIADVVVNGIDMILYGGTGRGSGRSTADRFAYNSIYSNRNERRPNSVDRYSVDDVTIETRREAEEVLRCMDEIMETYKMVRVADFYDLVGVTCHYTDNDYGWTNIRNAEIVRAMGGGYKIKMPRALPIK